MEWRSKEGIGPNGSELWIGRHLVAKAIWDGVTKHPDGKQWYGFIRLPLKSGNGFKTGRYSTEAEAQAAIEDAVRGWLREINEA